MKMRKKTKLVSLMLFVFISSFTFITIPIVSANSDTPIFEEYWVEMDDGILLYTRVRYILEIIILDDRYETGWNYADQELQATDTLSLTVKFLCLTHTGRFTLRAAGTTVRFYRIW